MPDSACRAVPAGASVCRSLMDNSGVTLRRDRDRRRPQRPDLRRLPRPSRTQGAGARAASRARRRRGHRRGLPRLQVFGLLVRRVAAAARDHPRARLAAPRHGAAAARRHADADAERRLPVARQRSRQDPPRDRASLAPRRRSLRRVRQGDDRDGPLCEADHRHAAAGSRRRSIRAACSSCCRWASASAA